MKFLAKYKWWILILFVFITVRIVIFGTFWQASLDRGGWENFYGNAQPAPFVFMRLFHDYCDWHPPLYYAFTSAILFLFSSQWFIYAAHMILAFASVFLVYKITRIFFEEKIALLSAFIMAIEPFWAWHNWLLVSENLSVFLFLLFSYFFLKFLKHFHPRDAAYSAIFLGLATLTRPNTLLLSLFLSFVLLAIFASKRPLATAPYLEIDSKKLLISLAVFNAVFFSVLAPWAIRNKIVYGRFTLANITSTNIYFYNLPPLISWQKNISYAEAAKIVNNKAERDLGKADVGDQGDCNLFSKDEFNRQLGYYERESKNFILANIGDYTIMHLLKATPFFFQPGYFDMYSAYTGEYNKPDITGLLLKKDLRDVKKFFSDINAKLIVYLLGLIFWVICSLAVFVSLSRSFLKEKGKFLFFLVAAAIIVYSALLISPFVLARYRLPVYPFFFIPLVYLAGKLLQFLKLKFKKTDGEQA